MGFLLASLCVVHLLLLADRTNAETAASGNTTQSEPFYPFGLNNGDTKYDYNNYYFYYGQYFQIQTETGFPFFGGKYHLINIYMQGFLTLGKTSSYSSPIRFPSYSRNDFIAPFWTTWNNGVNAALSYRQVTSGSVLQEVTSDINQYNPQLNFSAAWAFIATWNWTKYYSTAPLEATFQVVLVTDGTLSFVMMNYGNLSATSDVQVGYDTFNSTNYFSMPGSFQSNITNLSFTSNVNVRGRWVFRTDYCYNNCLFQDDFYPYGPNNGDSLIPPVNDGNSSVILLTETLQFFGTEYNKLYVNNNGFLTFDQPVSSSYPSMFRSGYDIIAPLWSNWNNAKSGVISYRQVTSGGDLQQATSDINQYFPQLNFTATWVFIATWDNVAFYNMDTETSFQVVLISDGNQSFVLMNYGRISSVISSVQAGFVTADSMIYFNMLEYSSYTDLTFSSNVNEKGRWVFQTNINYVKGPFLPFGTNNGDTQQYLPSYYYRYYYYYYTYYSVTGTLGFPFFGGKYYQLYIYPKGYLTFPWSVYATPVQFPIYSRNNYIAPFWMLADYIQSAVVSYRQVTSGSVLEQATSDILKYFPELNFTATWVFIVTWNWMEYYPTMGNNTIFQVVLVSDGHLSFIMMNYGNLAPKTQSVQVGYDTFNSTNYFSMPESFQSNITTLSFTSNVNVTGRWVFRTDSCPNNCLLQENFYPFGPNNGDTVNPAADDESSSVILLNETFQFFGSVHNQLYVNNYGFLTFDQPVSSSYSSMFGSGYDTIAPLWSYWNTTKSGVISYRQVTSGSDLQQATSDINQYFPQLNFTATWVFIATWDSVAYGNMDTETSFQVVLISNGNFSFVLLNYGRISSVISNMQAGFVTADSMIYFSILDQISYTDLTFSSNIND
uniref:NIDO domain-containing protein n=1 Tax=Scleropages formosus TaxID=113540 RepID=A0A8C9T7P5_SCLFO